MFSMMGDGRHKKKILYLQQEFKYGIVTIESEEFRNSLGVQDFEGSILEQSKRD